MIHRRAILILGGDADGNLGDRAILMAMCAHIHRVQPEAEIIAVSRHPRKMHSILGATVLPRGLKGLPQLCAAARRSRLVLVGGGGLFQDDDSLIKMPYWAARCLLVRLCGPRLFGCSIGVGPLRSFTSRLAAMFTFALMQRISVRDPLARRVAKELTAKPVQVVPDPAFMLEPADEAVGERLLREQGITLDDGPLIGVTIRRWFPPKPRWIPHHLRRGNSPQQEADNRRLVQLYAAALDRALSRCGGRVVMMPTYHQAHEGDEQLCRQVLAAMQSERKHLLRIDDPALYQAIAGRLSVMVGGRMHPTILAASAGAAVVGLAYNPKFHGVFELLGASQQVMDVADLFASGDSDAFADLIESALHRKPTQPHRAAKLAEQTRQWLNEVLRHA